MSTGIAPPNIVEVPPGPINPRVLAVFCAMLHVEGQYGNAMGPGALNNNPLDLRSWGSLPVSKSGFAMFPCMADGVLAGYRDVLANVGHTLREFIFRFAPPSENNSADYLAFVSRWSGIGEDDTL